MTLSTSVEPSKCTGSGEVHREWRGENGSRYAERAPAGTIGVGKAGLEPARLSARDPKSRSSANSDTPPDVDHDTIRPKRPSIEETVEETVNFAGQE